MKKSEEIYKTAFLEMGFIPFPSVMSMVKTVPDMIKLGGLVSVHRMVSSYIKHPKLRIMLSFHPLFIGGNPFSTTALYCLISYLERTHGVHFAMGGTGALVNGLANLIALQGNAIRLNAEVSEITLENQRATGVRLVSGEMLAADIVVSNADSAFTHRNLLPAEAKGRWSDAKLTRTRFSMSLFVWYFGTNRRYEDVPHHAIVLGPRYKELLQDIFERKILADDFSLYLHRPTATDPSLAPSGCDAFYVLSPVPNLLGDTDWMTKAEPYRRAIEQRLSETLLPGLRESVVTSRIMTPLDFRDRLNSLHGAAFGIEPIMLQSAYFRPHNRCGDIENLYLVGAGTHPGAGVPGVLCSAKIMDSLVPEAQQHVAYRT